jgi:hypothetical protein
MTEFQGIDTADLLDKFSQNQDKNETVEILKELFDEKKLKKITDLTPDGTSLVTIINVTGKHYNIPLFNKITSEWTELQLSKGRKSRKEVIDAIRGQSQQKTTNDKIRDVFRGG